MTWDYLFFSAILDGYIHRPVFFNKYLETSFVASQSTMKFEIFYLVVFFIDAANLVFSDFLVAGADDESVLPLLDTADILDSFDTGFGVNEDQPIENELSIADKNFQDLQDNNDPVSKLQAISTPKTCEFESKSEKICPTNYQVTDPANSNSPSTQQNNQPIIKLHLTSNQKKCQFKPESPEECPSSDYLIYPVNCAGARNSEVLSLLASWKVIYKTSTNKQCGGTLFWLAENLPSDQVDALANLKDVVADVVPDIYGEMEGVTKPHETKNEKHSTIFLNRRDNDYSVSIQSNAPDHLAFISRSDRDFLYFTDAGQDVTLYVVEGGADPRNSEFVTNSVIKYFLHTIRSNGVDGDSDPGGHGSCVLSLAAGDKYGPVKELKAVVVKVGTSGTDWYSNIRYITISDFLDGLQTISDDLYNRRKKNENVKGYTVINVSLAFAERYDNVNVRIMKHMLEKLIYDYQVVIVVSGGNYLSQYPRSKTINRFPALFAPDLPLIVVGGIDITQGRLHRKSLPGPQITILAPFQAVCAGPTAEEATQTAEGTSVSAPITAGILSGMLSGAWGEINRRNIGKPGFTMAVAARKYIKDKGRRFGTFTNLKTVSNGLDATKKPPLYGWTL